MTLSIALLLPACPGSEDPAPPPTARAEARADRPSGSREHRASDDPWAALAAINELPSDLEQQVAVERLLADAPGVYPPPPEVCERLRREQARDRCLSLARRPHLILKSERALTAPPAPVPDAIAREFACLGAPCDEGQTPFECATARAQIAGHDGAEGAIGLCGCLDHLDLNRECRFFAAQEAIRAGGPPAVTHALALCDFGGGFQSDCVWHVLEPALGSLIGECPLPEEDWRLLFQVGLDLRDEAHAGGEREAEQQRWSRAMATAFSEVFCLPPGLVPALPPASTPHLRATAAWWAVASSSPSADLEQLRATAAAALDGDATLGPVNEHDIVDFRTPVTPPRTPPDLPEGIQGQIFLVTGFRTASPDADADLTICLLLSAVRLGRDPAPLLVQVGPSDDPALRFTMERVRGQARRPE